MKIKSYLHDYDVVFTEDFFFFEQFKNIPNKLVVIDKKVYGLYQEILNRHFDPESLCLIHAVEQEKTIETALMICKKATEIDAKRNLKLIAIGGGIIQDIVGFAANILYRGVSLILVPTTLLAQADSCVGSKNSLNYMSYKNLLGTFYPPETVYICFSFLETLDHMDFNSGLGEIIKFNIMAGPDNLSYIEKKCASLLSRDYQTVKEFIINGLEYKKRFIEMDEFDQKERRLLNFAHTFGHAYEVISNYAIPHGLAVLLGMITANWISVGRKLLEADYAKRVESLCMQVYNASALKYEDCGTIISILKKDKKRQGEEIAAVLMSSDGALSVVQDVTNEEVENALTHMISLFSKE